MSELPKIKKGGLPGSGRPSLPTDYQSVTIRLSPAHIIVFKELGNGKIAAGIRKAADLLTIGTTIKNK
ncbi:MAG: hypothetical protein ACYC0M_15765 [Burkholderiales bacterium]